MTKVVNLYKEKYDIYIGRKGHGNDGYFGNPFSMLRNNDLERNRVIEEYKVYFYKRLKEDDEFKQRILQLKNKTLGCFCKPKPCHGDVIVDYLNTI